MPAIIWSFSTTRWSTSPTRCIRGARSRNSASMRSVHRSGGSKTWESEDSTSRSSISGSCSGLRYRDSSRSINIQDEQFYHPGLPHPGPGRLLRRITLPGAMPPRGARDRCRGPGPAPVAHPCRAMPANPNKPSQPGNPESSDRTHATARFSLSPVGAGPPGESSERPAVREGLAVYRRRGQPGPARTRRTSLEPTPTLGPNPSGTALLSVETRCASP